MNSAGFRSRVRLGLIGVSTLGLVAAWTIVGHGARAPAADAAASALATAPSSDASDVWPVTECGTVSGHGCAPTSKRVDLVRPTFSDPLHIDNPLNPVSDTQTVVQVGIVDGLPFRSETTTLHRTGVVNWYGTKIPVVLVQYLAYLDGRITEVALDRYAQADDGSVWYFGEDVFDYQGGGTYFTEGTWLAGRDGQPAMVMPAHPKLGDVYRVENVLGIVFEELTVVEVDKTVQGPSGPVHGAIVVDELGLDGGHSRKTLAPGYGEFLTRNGRELEAMAVATPIDTLPGGAPVELREALTATWGELEYARAKDWQLARPTLRRIEAKVAAIGRTQQPPRVMALLHKAVRQLAAAVDHRRPLEAQAATVEIAQSLIDVEARYLDPTDVDIARFHLLTQGLRVDAEAGDTAGVRGDVAALEWMRDRVGDALDATELAAFDDQLAQLRLCVSSGSLVDAADIAVRLAMSLRNAAAT
jgi:hypothetical protein